VEKGKLERCSGLAALLGPHFSGISNLNKKCAMECE